MAVPDLRATPSPRIVSLGEVLWDLLPSGPVLGGAPANFAFHARGLGADTTLISRVGDDEAGREILGRLAKAGLPLQTIQIDPSQVTGMVSVRIHDGGQPAYVIHMDVAWDAITAEEHGRAACENAEAICFGILAQRSPASYEGIQSLVAAAPPDAWRILDLNLRQPFFSRSVIEPSLTLANALKLNDTELFTLAGMFEMGGGPDDQLKALSDRFDLRLIALTRGAHGSTLFADGIRVDQPAPVVEVCDTIGAGDAFTAAMTLGLLADWPLEKINRTAGEVAAYVCTQAGATPELPEDLRRAFCDGHDGHRPSRNGSSP